MALIHSTTIPTSNLVLCLDPANQHSSSVNVHPLPLDLFGWVQNANAATLSRDSATSLSPARGIPMLMNVTGNDPYQSSTTTVLAPAASGQSWTVSVYVKASVNTTGQLFILGINSSGAFVEAPNGSINITTDWTRVSFTSTLSNVNTVNIAARLDGPETSGTGINIWWDGMQLQRGSTLTNFNSIRNVNGNRWYDLTGNGFFTINSGATFNSATSGYLEFDGQQGSWASDSDVNRTNFGSNSFSISCFVYPTVISSIDNPSYSRICEKTGFPNSFFLIAVNSTGTVNFTGYDNTPTTPKAFGVTTSSTLSLNTWYHVTAVLNQTAQTVKIYINGVDSATNSLPSGFTTMTNNNVFYLPSNYAEIGARYSTFLIYNAALTNEQILTIFNAYRGRYGI